MVVDALAVADAGTATRSDTFGDFTRTSAV